MKISITQFRMLNSFVIGNLDKLLWDTRCAILHTNDALVHQHQRRIYAKDHVFIVS